MTISFLDFRFLIYYVLHRRAKEVPRAGFRRIDNNESMGVGVLVADLEFPCQDEKTIVYERHKHEQQVNRAVHCHCTESKQQQIPEVPSRQLKNRYSPVNALKTTNPLICFLYYYANLQ